MSTRKLRMQNNYSLTAIENMDETPLWMDMPGDTTIARTGVNQFLGQELNQFLCLQVGMRKISLLCVWQRWLVGKS